VVEIQTLHENVLAQLRARVVHDSDFTALEWLNQHVRPIRTVIDVGANGGQTIASVRAVLGEDVEIHSFEANPSLWPGLDHLAGLSGGVVHVHHSGLGSSPGELPLLVPTVRGEVYLEESTLDPSQFDKPWVKERFEARGHAPVLTRIPVPIAVGDSFDFGPDFIKVDVEGFESEVLRGFTRTIERSRPVLMVENSDWHAVTGLLDELGYKAFRWDGGAMLPFFGECTNTFYVPAEVSAEFERPTMQGEVVQAGAYDEAADMEFHRDEVARMHAALSEAKIPIPADALILDVGGGAGIHSGFLTDRVGRVICMDFSDQNARFDGKLVGLLAEKFERNGVAFDLSRFEFHQGDAMNLMYRDNWFDFIVSLNAFEHIPDPAVALPQMLRVLKPGGILYLTFDPMWTCDSGSHFQYRVPEPWQHLVSDDDAFVERLRAAGAGEGEVNDYLHAMNRQRPSFYRALFDEYRKSVDYLAEYEWSGCTDPSNPEHANFKVCLQMGYEEAELMSRGMTKVIRKR
jgi:FkbM family methyltransferase